MLNTLFRDSGPILTWLPTFLIVLLITFLIKSILQGRPKNFPPGLPILPILGSFFSMPFGPSLEMLRGLRKKYGDIASFAIFGTKVVVVSNINTIKEVFSQRSTTDRPDMVFTYIRNTSITDGRCSEVGVISSSGQLWQEQRRFLLHNMRDLGLGKSSYEPVMIEEIAELMEDLAKKEGQPIDMRRVFNRSVINILWGMVMGRRYPYGHAKLEKIIKAFFQPADATVISPLDHIPFVKKLIKFLPVHRDAFTAIKNISKFLQEELYDFLDDEDLRTGNNFTAVYLKEIEKKENPNFNMDQLLGLIFDMFIAGMETTSSTLNKAVHFLCKHPHVQERVQEELDAVVGMDRLPSFTDMERLPYVQATIAEVQRAFNMIRFSLPHATNQDCKIGGYDIPKGTWLLMNLDEAHRNPENWKNPLQFDPTNFLDENGKYVRNPALNPFGVGKRVCAGESLARLELFLFFTHLFQRFTFKIEKEYKSDKKVNPLFNVPMDYIASVKCRFK